MLECSRPVRREYEIDLIMKRILIGLIAASVMLVLLMALEDGCSIASGIMGKQVVPRLARCTDTNTAEKIFYNARSVSSNELERLSHCRVGDDALTVLMPHPNFPQEHRSELFRGCEGYWYFVNARDRGTLTDEDVLAIIERRCFNPIHWLDARKALMTVLRVETLELKPETLKRVQDYLGTVR